MSQYGFEGEYRRKPVQRLGGNSRGSEQKDTVLQKAQAERQRRERERAVAAAILRLQGYFRGCLDRRRMNRLWRSEFNSKISKSSLSDGDFTRQILLLNSFFGCGATKDQEADVASFLGLGKQILLRTQPVVEWMKSDAMGVLEIKKILEKSLLCLNRERVQPAVLIRLLETFTNPELYEKDTTEGFSDKTVGIVTSVWLYLVQQANFFQRYRHMLEKRIPRMTSEAEVNRITQSLDYLKVYTRVICLRTNFNLGERLISVSVKKTTYDANSALELIYSKFVESFAENSMPLNNSGIAAFYIIPGLARDISWAEWCAALPRFCTQHADNSSAVRQIFYVTLTLVQNISADININSLFRAINLLLPSIDPRYAPSFSTNGLTRHIRDFEEEMDVEESETPVIDNIYFQESSVLYKILKRVLNTIKLSSWLTPFHIEHWSLMYPVISCLIRLEPKLASLDFMFLPVLCYKREFMRSLCVHFMSTKPLANDDILTFCWFFGHLLKTLHDAEFFSGIPIRNEELERIIVTLREKFSDSVLSNSEASDSGAITASKVVATTLMALHDRNIRMNIFPEEIFISPTLSKICPVETHILQFSYITNQSNPDLPPMDTMLLRIFAEFPFALSFHDRVKAWNRLLDMDKEIREPNMMGHREDIQIRRNYIYEDAFEKLSPENVQDIRRHIRISLVNKVGVMEAGIDGGGLLREFLTESTKAAVDPNRGLFRVDSQNRIYPNPVAKKLMDDFYKHFFVIGRLVGKALYEQTLLELPMAAFFIQTCIEGKVSSAVDFLATLDPDLHKNLLALKTFTEDFNSLGLDFTIALEELGETKMVELKKNGRDIPVDKDNVIEYIHLVADYKINKEMEEECRSFRLGMLDVVPSLRMFSWKELETLISGSDRPIDVDDWRANTIYGPGFTDNHETIKIFWLVVKDFDERHLRKLLKFVTSCSRPPLLGFKDLIPKFGIQSAGKVDRLPTAATCMNLLKLPEFDTAITMREKLIYAIDAQAGFELS